MRSTSSWLLERVINFMTIIIILSSSTARPPSDVIPGYEMMDISKVLIQLYSSGKWFSYIIQRFFFFCSSFSSFFTLFLIRINPLLAQSHLDLVNDLDLKTQFISAIWSEGILHFFFSNIRLQTKQEHSIDTTHLFYAQFTRHKSPHCCRMWITNSCIPRGGYRREKDALSLARTTLVLRVLKR